MPWNQNRSICHLSPFVVCLLFVSIEISRAFLPTKSTTPRLGCIDAFSSSVSSLDAETIDPEQPASQETDPKLENDAYLEDMDDPSNQYFWTVRDYMGKQQAERAAFEKEKREFDTSLD